MQHGDELWGWTGNKDAMGKIDDDIEQIDTQVSDFKYQNDQTVFYKVSKNRTLDGITTEYSEIKSIVLQFGNYKVMEVYTDKNPFAEILNFGID